MATAIIPSRERPLPATTRTLLEENSIKVKIIVGVLFLALLALVIGGSIQRIPVAVKGAHTAYLFSGIFLLIALGLTLSYSHSIPQAARGIDRDSSIELFFDSLALYFYNPLHPFDPDHPKPDDFFPRRKYADYFPEIFTITLGRKEFNFNLTSMDFLDFRDFFITLVPQIGEVFTFQANPMSEPSRTQLSRDNRSLDKIFYRDLYDYLVSQAPP